MSPKDRGRASALETIMARHAGFEARTVADLRNAGLNLNSIDAAKKRLQTQKGFPGFTQSQINIAIAAMDSRKKKR